MEAMMPVSLSARFMALIAACIAAGCASVSDVVSTGADTYMVTAHGIDGNGSGAAQKAIAMQSAGAHCKMQTAQLVVTASSMVEPAFGRAPSAEVDFRCVSAEK